MALNLPKVGDLASYQRPVAPPTAAAPMSSSTRLGQFATQQLGSLSAGTGVAAQGVKALATPQGASLTAPRSAVGSQLDKTVSNIQSGAARVNAMYALRKQQRATQAQQQAPGGSAPARGGRNPGASGFSQLNDTAGLTAVGNGQFLANNAASNLAQLSSAFKVATGKNISVTEGWRSMSTQQRYYALHQAGKMPQAVAKPGTSVHGTGRAADLGGLGNPGTSAFNWLVNNAQKYGWSWTGKNFNESWHWEYVGS